LRLKRALNRLFPAKDGIEGDPQESKLIAAHIPANRAQQLARHAFMEGVTQSALIREAVINSLILHPPEQFRSRVASRAIHYWIELKSEMIAAGNRQWATDNGRCIRLESYFSELQALLERRHLPQSDIDGIMELVKKKCDEHNV